MPEPRSVARSSRAFHLGPYEMPAFLGAFRYCVMRCRVIVVVLLVGLALMLSAQGRDLFVAHGEDHHTGRLAISSFVWAFAVWGWSRLLLDVRYAAQPSRARELIFWRRWLPRVLGTAAFAVVLIGALNAERRALATWAGVALVLFLAWVLLRRPVIASTLRMLYARRGQRAGWIGRRFALVIRIPRLRETPPHAGLRVAVGFRPGPRGRRRWLVAIATAVSVALGAVLCVAAIVNPVSTGAWTGAMVFFFLWAVTFLPYGSAATYLADRAGVPLLSALALAAFVFSVWSENHTIRDLGALPDRRTVDVALDEWADRNGAVAGGPEVPFVVVATAGGGIRAAYWTATVLGTMDRAPPFRDRLFGISGVSGGSVGATIYRALTDLDPASASTCTRDLAACGQEVLGEDSLGPIAAALLVRDLVQLVLPVRMFGDRAQALEQAWERAFEDKTGSRALRESLSALSRRGPHLFLNATWVENGRRIVASDLALGAGFERSNDQLARLGFDLRLSTAAHNSARFPFVSPAGTWCGHNCKPAGTLQDGGMFENYGAETALEILDVACTRFACPAGAPGTRATVTGPARPRIAPIVVIITSDPKLPAKGFVESAERPPRRFGDEVLTTLRTYEAVRNGRGAEAAARLQDWARAHGRAALEFRMCEADDGEHGPPLGWALSRSSKEQIRSFLSAPSGPGALDRPCERREGAPCRELNRRALACLRERLSDGTGTAEVGPVSQRR